MKNFFLMLSLIFFYNSAQASANITYKAYGAAKALIEKKIDKVVFCGAIVLGAHALYTAIKAWNDRPLLCNNNVDELRGYTLNEMRLGPLNKKSFISFASMSGNQWQQLIDFLSDVYGQDVVRHSLVHQYNLYQFPKFVRIIRTWQEYQEINSDFIERVHYDRDVLNKVAKLQGFTYGHTLIDFIKQDLKACSAN